jgi:hypothetical protein
MRLKLVITILFGLFVIISLFFSGFVLMVPKDRFTAIIRPLPVIGLHTDTIVNIKKDITIRGAYLVEDTLYAVTSTWRNISDFSLTKSNQKVVINLVPLRTTNSEANKLHTIISKTMSTTNPKKNQQHTTPVEENLLKVVTTHPKKKSPLTPIPQTTSGASEHKTGLTFYKGIDGALKNFKTARKWFLKSAAKGNAAAQYNLGIMSYTGQGIEQDFSDAAKWFEQAAKQGNTLAQYNLGFLFYEGKGVAKDYSQAFVWIDRAARLGDKKAIQARPTIEKLLPEDFIKEK